MVTENFKIASTITRGHDLLFRYPYRLYVLYALRIRSVSANAKIKICSVENKLAEMHVCRVVVGAQWGCCYIPHYKHISRKYLNYWQTALNLDRVFLHNACISLSLSHENFYFNAYNVSLSLCVSLSLTPYHCITASMLRITLSLTHSLVTSLFQCLR